MVMQELDEKKGRRYILSFGTERRGWFDSLMSASLNVSRPPIHQPVSNIDSRSSLAKVLFENNFLDMSIAQQKRKKKVSFFILVRARVMGDEPGEKYFHSKVLVRNKFISTSISLSDYERARRIAMTINNEQDEFCDLHCEYSSALHVNHCDKSSVLSTNTRGK